LAFLGDDKFLSNKPKGLGTSRDMNSLKAGRVVLPDFAFLAPVYSVLTDAQSGQVEMKIIMDVKSHGIKGPI